MVDSERAQYWLGVGAQPTEAVAAILEVTGDWQKFKGLPGRRGHPARRASPKPDKKAVFEAAAKESLGDAGPATTPRKRAAKAAEAPAAQAAEAPAAEAAPEPTAVVAEPTECRDRGRRDRGSRSSCTRGCRGHGRSAGSRDGASAGSRRGR